MLAKNPRTELDGRGVGVADKQSRRLRLALFLLVVALAIVIVTNREFWFGTDEAVQPDHAGSEVISTASPETELAHTVRVPVVRPTPKNHLARKTPTEPSVTAPSANDSANRYSPAVTTNRRVLPPLEVEVVAGDMHRTVHPGSNVTNVGIPNDSNRVATITTSVALPTNAAERERLSHGGNVPELRQTVEVPYPLLGQHANVQGSVVLQAVVGTDGTIEDLRILSGPAILTAAAQQAVRQWRFKPYLQNGQPVETRARITVNFSIKISDNPAKTS
jgi:TonB family protein